MGFMGLGEPGLGAFIIVLGAWINRDFKTPVFRNAQESYEFLMEDVGNETTLRSTSMDSEPIDGQRRWRLRDLSLFGYKRTINTPDTSVFRSRFLSRVLLRFPFIIEIMYWTLIYGVSDLSLSLCGDLTLICRRSINSAEASWR